MRRLLCAAAALPLTVCIPIVPDWVVTTTRFRGVKVEVVQPGPYGSLLNVPPGKHRATVLPLDTVELEWFFAAPPGVTVPPPIWVVCPGLCFDHSGTGGIHRALLYGLEACPTPLPLFHLNPCRLGEGHRIRVTLGGAFTASESPPTLLLIGARHDGLASATCLERLAATPLDQLESCIVGMWNPTIGPDWAALPFDPTLEAIPPEILAQEANTNPEVIGFAVLRERGSTRTEVIVGPGESAAVREGDRVAVTPLFSEDSRQQYWYLINGDKNIPWSGTLSEATESLGFIAGFSGPVDEYTYSNIMFEEPITFVIPGGFEPTTLWVDVVDFRGGHAFSELLLVPADDP